jgi:SH3-like domain-containing protein
MSARRTEPRSKLAAFALTLLQLMPSSSLQGQSLIEPPARLEAFASLRSDTVNMRVGPSRDYPIIWTYQRKGWPVAVIDRYDNWRQVVDPEGIRGWIHSSLLSGARTVLVRPDAASPLPLRDAPAATAPIRARLAEGVIARLKACEAGWCRVQIGDYSGWLEGSALWGVR